MDNYEEDDEEYIAKSSTKASNVLPLWGNERTMNLNPLILTNIQSSHYFKVNLYELKTYHEVVDEIYYKVQHLEPWEKGSRRTSGQTGMCGGVRGVGAGGIVSTAYCLLYKLYTLKLTRKQLNGLLTHGDSPYIRALGFMYVRYVLPPANLLDWYEPYLDDEEEMDVKAGGGQTMKLGMILRQWLVKLEWFSTLFPRIPVPIQQKIQKLLEDKFPMQSVQVVNTPREREDRIERPATGGRGEGRGGGFTGGGGRERDSGATMDSTRGRESDYLRDDRDRTRRDNHRGDYSSSSSSMDSKHRSSGGHNNPRDSRDIRDSRDSRDNNSRNFRDRSPRGDRFNNSSSNNSSRNGGGGGGNHSNSSSSRRHR